MTPLLIIINKDLVVTDSYVCRDGADQEDLFKQELLDRGIEVTAEQMEDGCITLECGDSVIMTWARPSNDYGIPKIGDTDLVWCCQCNVLVSAQVTKVAQQCKKVTYYAECNHTFTHS